MNTLTKLLKTIFEIITEIQDLRAKRYLKHHGIGQH
jgi:hypothetical protein